VKKIAITAVGLAVAAAGLAMFLAPELYSVVDKGHDIRPYDSGVVYKIRLLDTVNVYAAEESRPDPDAISGSAMVALATAALMTALLLGATGARSRLRNFYALSAAGFGFLAIDEFFALHETVGHNLLFVADIPGVERPDDVIFALLVVPAAIYLYIFRDVIASSRRAVRFFAVALGLFVLAGISDIAGVGTDELFEVLSAGAIVGGFVSLIAMHLSAALQLGESGKAATATPATAPAESPPALAPR
jgi:hypothetical protein